jgi:hypothetical protein
MDKYETTARKHAVRAVKDFNATMRRLYEVEARLRQLGPFVRDAFFQDLIQTPDDAAHRVWQCLKMADSPLGHDCEQLFFNVLVSLPPYATYGQVANLIIEYAHRRGWKKRLEKLLSEDCREALIEIKTAALEEYNANMGFDAAESEHESAQTGIVANPETCTAEPGTASVANV